MKLLSFVAIVCASLWLAGCQNGVTGPSLAASISNVDLKPTIAGVTGGEDLCCCHIVGSVTNESSVTVHVELLFDAKASNGARLGTAIAEIPDLPAGANQRFEAVGLTEPCRNLSLFQVVQDKQIRLKGLFQPPS